MNSMSYLGYTARIEYDGEDEVFYGDVQDIRDTIAFEGSSVQELQDALRRSIDTYLEFCREQGKEPDRPFSGRLVLRMDPSLHRAISVVARESGKSINAWLVEVLDAAVSNSGVLSPGHSNGASSRTSPATSLTSRRGGSPPGT